jgi:hypothetical protein
MLIDAVSVSDSGMRGAEAAINEFKTMLRTFVGMLYPDAERYGVDMDVVVSGLAGATIYIAKTWAQSGFKHSLDKVLMHNMLMYRSLDAIYRQADAQSRQEPASVPPVATRATPKGRRASDA